VSYNKNITVNNNIYNKNIYKEFGRLIITEIARRKVCSL